MIKYLIFCTIAIFAACDGIDEIVEEDDQEFEATVLGVSDCNLVQLEFHEGDEEVIKQITGGDGVLYNAVNYSKILFQPGQKLWVKIRKLTNAEISACPAFAPTYPGLFLLKFRVVD